MIGRVHFNLGIEKLLISGGHRGQRILRAITGFQSRNRETSDFRFVEDDHTRKNYGCEFQSRNRETSDFRSNHDWAGMSAEEYFNLGIEKLLISGDRKKIRVGILGKEEYFNLGIEKLLISGKTTPLRRYPRKSGFQSRNRETSDFRLMKFDQSR